MRNWAGRTILIAEDDLNNYILMQFIIKRTGAKILRANNGKEALDIVNKLKNVDAILMDYQMPVMSGAEAIIKIRRVNKNVPIIVISGYSPCDLKNMSASNGYNETLTKPIQVDQLLGTIERHFQPRGMA
ncbi:MAG: response regulator [Chlorobi bacterium]|nr:response regulator [Chlorobiota bacterium]